VTARTGCCGIAGSACCGTRGGGRGGPSVVKGACGTREACGARGATGAGSAEGGTAYVIMYPERGGVRGCKQVHNRIPGYARVLSVMTYIFGRTAQSTSEWKCSPLAALGSSGGMRIEAFPSVVGKSDRLEARCWQVRAGHAHRGLLLSRWQVRARRKRALRTCVRAEDYAAAEHSKLLRVA
jgi:hypothetical protein